MPKIHITGRKLPKAKKGFSVNTDPCPPGPNGQMMIRVDGECIEVGKTERPVFPTMKPGEWSYTYDEKAIQRALAAGEPMAPGPGAQVQQSQSEEDPNSYKIVNGEKVCGPGYLNIDGVCVRDMDRNYSVYNIPGKPGFYTTAPMPVGTPNLLETVFVKSGREPQWYDNIADVFGVDSPKELRKLDKFINQFSQTITSPFKRRDKLTGEDREEISSYWSQQMQDPVVRERVKNDPIAYQMLRLEAYKEAGVGNKVLKKEACVAGFGFHWDEEKQTCVEDQAPHNVSGEASIRTINPMVYRELFEDIEQLSFEDHDSRIKARMPKDAKDATYKVGTGSIPYYAYNPIEKNGGYTENGMLSRFIDSRVFDEEGKPATKVADIFRSGYYENDLNKLNKVVSDYKKDEYETDQKFEQTVTQVQKEGLGDFIDPGQNRQFIKQRLLETAEYAPGVSSGDLKKEATRLPGLFGKDVGSYNNFLNTQSWKINKYHSEKKDGNPIIDFFGDVATGTYSDFINAQRYGRGAGSQLGLWNAPKSLEGFNIDAPSIQGRDQQMYNTSQLGLLGAGHYDELYASGKETAKNINDVISGRGNLKKALRIPLDIAGTGFNAMLAAPVFSSAERTAAKIAFPKLFTKPGLNVALKNTRSSLINPFKETLGVYNKSIPRNIYTGATLPVRAVNNLFFHPLTVATSAPAKIGFGALGAGRYVGPGYAFKAGEYGYTKAFGEGNDPFSIGFKLTGADKAFESIYDDANATQPLKIETVSAEGTPSFNYYDQYVAQKEQENIDKGQGFLNDPNQRRLYKFFPQEYKDLQEGIYNIKSGGKTYKFDTRLLDKTTNSYTNKLILDALTADKKQLTPPLYDYNKKIFNLDIDPQIKKRVSSFFTNPAAAPYLQSIQVNRYGGATKRRKK
jgi:hypothetical protein